MKNSDKEEVLSTIDSEGFDYTFTHYSKFEKIKDKQFHILRKNYIRAQAELEKYLQVDE